MCGAAVLEEIRYPYFAEVVVAKHFTRKFWSAFGRHREQMNSVEGLCGDEARIRVQNIKY